MATSPTQRTLAYCKKQGWLPAVVEKWIPQVRRRNDLYGGIDLVAMRPGEPGLLGIQATSNSNAAAREHKLAALPTMVEWLKAGLDLEVWGWRKLKVGKAHRWRVSRRKAYLVGDEIRWEKLEDDK